MLMMLLTNKQFEDDGEYKKEFLTGGGLISYKEGGTMDFYV